LKNITFIINTLLHNDYPLKFIFDIINNIIEIIQRRKFKIHNNKEENKELKNDISWFAISFIPEFTNKFKQNNNKNIKISFHSTNKLNKCAKIQKDRLINNKM